MGDAGFDGDAAIIQFGVEQLHRLLHHVVEGGDFNLQRRRPDGL